MYREYFENRDAKWGILAAFEKNTTAEKK